MTQTADRKLGMFAGVFVPNILTIIGVILYLRSGWVVGAAGLSGALLILAVAILIAMLTAMSLASVSTNGPVGAGGVYFLVSRSLGLEIGGAIGVPIFMAQSLAIGFYLVGFADSVRILIDAPLGQSGQTLTEMLPILTDFDTRIAALAAMAVFFCMAWIGATVVARFQYVILGIIALSFAAFFVGYTGQGSFKEVWTPAYPAGHQFWTVFAIFFPPMTGILAGVSMSGDLRDPSRAIPRGTFLAILVTAVLFGVQFIWLAVNASREALLDDNMVMAKISVFAPLIYMGVWAATLSSALAVMLAAPRTLQALARDGIAPGLLGGEWGKACEPRAALIICTVIAGLCVLLADLNLIASIITMVFLAAFGTLNLVAALESLIATPSWRPSFRVHWVFPAVGFVACVQVMLFLNVPATLAAMLTIAVIYLVLTRRRYETAWGDLWSGFWFAVTRLGLLRFTESRQHVRNWRPVILVLAGDPRDRPGMIDFANNLESRRGLLFLAQVVSGDWDQLLPRAEEMEKSMREFARERRLAAVVKAVVADDFEKGVTTLLQVLGLGQFRPNTVLIGWSDDVVKQEAFTRAVRRILQMQRNLLVFSGSNAPPGTLAKRIDVWWYTRLNGSLMLTLADLLRSSAAWRGHQLRLVRVVSDEASRAAVEQDLDEILRDLRIECERQIIVSQDPILQVIARESKESEVCFTGLPIEQMDVQTLRERYGDLIKTLRGNVFLTKSWENLRHTPSTTQPPAVSTPVASEATGTVPSNASAEPSPGS